MKNISLWAYFTSVSLYGFYGSPIYSGGKSGYILRGIGPWYKNITINMQDIADSCGALDTLNKDGDRNK